MKKSARMLPVQQLNERREKEAAVIVSQVRQTVIKEESQLQTLMQYREEYHASLSVGSKPSGKQLQDFHSFLINLNIAIDQQEHRLAQVGVELEHKITEWEKAYGKLKAMDKLIDRFKYEEVLIEGKNEQKFIDDLPKRPQFRL